MSYKQIEGAREIRMWISQIIFPTVIIGVILYNDPNFRSWADQKVRNIKSKIKNIKTKS